jgi:putative chitobiose transport system permease protein
MTSNAAGSKRKKVISTILVYLLLIIIAIVCAGPFLWLLSTSFKSGQNIYDLRFFYKNPSFVNYIGVINFMNLPMYFMNTVIITVGAIALDVIFSSMCAYPLACMDFPGKKIVFGALISTMILPAAAGLVIKYLIISHAHLLDTYLGVILPASVTVFSIILMRQSYLNVPKELMDAARIDGASEIKTWWKIMLPEIMPTISTIIIFDFITHWNDFLWPIIVLQDPQKYPIATALQYLNGQFNYKFGYIAAGTIISIIPVIIVFIAFQKNYIEAVSGAVKG